MIHRLLDAFLVQLRLQQRLDTQGVPSSTIVSLHAPHVFGRDLLCTQHRPPYTEVDICHEERHRASLTLESPTIVVWFSDNMSACVHYQAHKVMLMLPKNRIEKESDLVDEDISILDVQTVELSNGAQALLLSQDSTSMSIKAEMLKAQCGDPYRRIVGRWRILIQADHSTRKTCSAGIGLWTTALR